MEQRAAKNGKRWSERFPFGTWLVGLILVPVTWGAAASAARGAVRSVSNSSELQSALGQAQPGDKIVLRDGVYAGQFTINGASGTAAAPITVRAENRHRAVLRGGGACSLGDQGFVIQRPYWTFADLRFQNHGR